MSKSIFLIGGGKGGVGKSLLSMTAPDAFSARFAKVTVDPPPSVARPLTTSS